jgi:hypothetical protein
LAERFFKNAYLISEWNSRALSLHEALFPDPGTPSSIQSLKLRQASSNTTSTIAPSTAPAPSASIPRTTLIAILVAILSVVALLIVGLLYLAKSRRVQFSKEKAFDGTKPAKLNISQPHEADSNAFYESCALPRSLEIADTLKQASVFDTSSQSLVHKMGDTPSSSRLSRISASSISQTPLEMHGPGTDLSDNIGLGRKL